MNLECGKEINITFVLSLQDVMLNYKNVSFCGELLIACNSNVPFGLVLDFSL